MSVKTIHYSLLIFVLIHCASISFGQRFNLYKAFAHNDYRHKRPLFDALENGFSYIEADIYLRGNKLIVSHILPFLKRNRTLEELYLNPLLSYTHSKQPSEVNSIYPITLMIDIKSNPAKTFPALIQLLEKYRHILSYKKDGKLIEGKVTIVISGRKPSFQFLKLQNNFIFLDEDLRRIGYPDVGSANMIASCKYSEILRWKGKGPISQREKDILIDYVQLAHQKGYKVRLWASPEKKNVWDELLKCNVDLINTNKLVKLRNYLVSERLSIVAEKVPQNSTNEFLVLK